MHATVAAMVTIALAAATTTAHAGSQDPKAPRFVDGDWTGALDYTGSLDTQGLLAIAGGLGTFELQVTGGQVSGTFTFLAQGTSTDAVSGSSADLVFGADGTVGGEAVEPVLDPQSASFEGTAQSQGFQIPIAFSAGPDSLVDAPMKIYSASCNQVTGDFAQDFGAALNAQGIPVKVKGYFAAVRTKTAPDGAAETLNALLNELDSVLEATQTGGVTTDDVITVVKKAEDFAASIPKNAACGLLQKPGQFQLAITKKIADLLDKVIEYAEVFTTRELIELMWVGVEVGAIGSGSVDQPFSAKILGNLESILTERLEAAVAAKDQAEIDTILEGAIAFGFTALSKLALEAQ